MATKEKMTDLLVSNLLNQAGIKFTPEGSEIKEVQEALKSASKKGTSHYGYPEYVAQVGEFILVIEDKASTDYQVKYINDTDKSTLLMDTSSVVHYAENGALHYALQIIQNSNFKKVFAFGCSGTEAQRLRIRPIFVTPNGYHPLPPVRSFQNFTEDTIERYYNESVLKQKSAERVELENILDRADTLHEALRNYGNLAEGKKPLVVSAILLALQYNKFSTEDLTGETGEDAKTDGQKIFEALLNYMDTVHVAPDQKKTQVIDSFRFIQTTVNLSTIHAQLGKTPLRYFAEYLQSNVLTAICNNHPEDVLGRFYGEFIRYSGGDGQPLGIVLTPKHITELFADLAQIQPTDKVFDPCCGTGGFLIAAMAKMLSSTTNSQQQALIRKHNLHGIELQPDMFSIATTNMILRGDGKSNLICGDFFQQSTTDLRQKGYTVGLMNPPYSQAKTKATQHLSELKFIIHLLDSLADKARCVVIVPQSTMVGGKRNKDKQDKEYILEHHTLEGVITLNTETFYGVATNPVIAVFTAHQPHPDGKLVKFVDFRQDGYETAAHIGLMPISDQLVRERKKELLDCWFQGKQASSKFIIRTTIQPDDEWLHSFYYFNDEIPTEADFDKAIADYLTFEFNMLTHGRGYLFEDRKEDLC